MWRCAICNGWVTMASASARELLTSLRNANGETGVRYCGRSARVHMLRPATTGSQACAPKGSLVVHDCGSL